MLLLKDIRYAARSLRRAPMFATAVVLTMMLAIGATTTIFTFVENIILRPLPFRDPGRILQIAEKNDKANLAFFESSVLNFVSWRERAQSFESIGAFRPVSFTLGGNGEPEQVSGDIISPAVTRVLGIRPIAGRDFTEEEEKPGAPPVAMIGEGLWRRSFAADPGLIGRTITLDGQATTVVGIAPETLALIVGGEIHTPLTIDPAKENRLNHLLFTFGRLKDGISADQARAEMDRISDQMHKEYPELHDWGVSALSLFESLVSVDLKNELLVLIGAVGCLLLIACANIANLFLVRAAARQRDMAVRAAMGASRSHLIRQFLVESLVLSLTGGIGGVLGAVVAVPALNNTLPKGYLPVPVAMNDVVLWFAFALIVFTAVLFGTAPAIRMMKVDLNQLLKQGSHGPSGRMSPRMHKGLVISELVLATVLLIGAGLFIRSLANLKRVSLGFAPQGLISFQLSLPTTKYPLNGRAAQLYRDLIDNLQSLPGVRGAAVSSCVPFGTGTYTTHSMITTDPSVLPHDAAVTVDWRSVTPRYFRTMGIPLLQGREFTPADEATGASSVVMVGRTTARLFWGDGDAIGHILRPSANPGIGFTIVGVVEDVRGTSSVGQSQLWQQYPTLYYPITRKIWPVMDVVLRSDVPSDQLIPAVRQSIHKLDPELALANIRTMEGLLQDSAAQSRLQSILLGFFALVAVLIASVGIYGVLAYSVNQRMGEMGIRMALGATRFGILRLIVGEGLKLAVIGIGVGLLSGLALSTALSSLLFEVAVYDTPTYISVGVILTSVAIAACITPALRACRVEPTVTLKCG